MGKSHQNKKAARNRDGIKENIYLMQHNPNRKYKDSVFSLYMSDPVRLIESYNAIQRENYALDTPIEINTLDDALYKERINDISFSLDGRYIILIEHQSTINENMPVRILLYLGRVLEKILDQENIYRKKRIPLMTPEFIVLYNGQEDYPDISYMRLSDAFISQPHKNEGEPAPSVELVVKVVNIGYGHNEPILKKSKSLEDYSIFIDKVQKYRDNGLPLHEAIREAVIYCKKNNIMQPFLTEHGSEVENMLFTEWDWNEAMKIEREEALEEGLTRGRAEGQAEGLTQGRAEGERKRSFDIAKKLLTMGLDLDTISKGTGLTTEQIKGIQAGA